MFHQLLTSLLDESAVPSLLLASPELALTAGIVLMLLGRLCGCDRKVTAHWVALGSTMAAFLLSLALYYAVNQSSAGLGAWTWVRDAEWPSMESAAKLADWLQALHGPYFSGMLWADQFGALVRVGLLLFLVFVISLTVLSGIPDQEDGPDFYTLLLGSVIGMLLMSNANHLLMVFLGIEMASVPSYAMVGFLKGRRQSSEAALKFAVYGAGAAGVMLYGLSLLVGLLGTGDFFLLGQRLNAVFSGNQASLADPAVRTLVLAMLMVFVGFAFKLSVVPFHFWTPDVFQGAAAEVGGFLSVASKAAAFALLVRLVLALMATPNLHLEGVYTTVGISVGALAAVTATFGNLAAYAQTNMKRLLAYSTIAHAGYMLMAIAALIVLQAHSASHPSADLNERSARAVEGLLYYLAAYLFMNLGAFAITALIRNEIFSEDIEDYRGLGYETPVLCVGMATCLFSLVGLPPLGGFVGKLFVFAALFDAGRIHWALWVVLALGGLNTVFSLIYYVGVLKVMYFDERPAHARRARVEASSSAYVLALTLPIVLLGVIVQPVSHAARIAAQVLFP